VERRVNNLEIIGNLCDAVRIDAHFLNLTQVNLIGFRSDNLNQTLVDGFLMIHGLDIGKHVQCVHFLCYNVSFLRRQLCAVLPVNLVAVVLLRVMGCSDHNACKGSVCTNRKRQHRNRTQRFILNDIDAVCCQNAGCQMRVLIRMQTAVAGNRYAALHGTRAILLNQICQTLRCCTDSETIHFIQTNAHCAAQTCCTEGQRCKKSLLDFLFIALQSCQFRMFLCGQSRRFHPLAIFFHIAHFKTPHISYFMFFIEFFFCSDRRYL